MKKTGENGVTMTQMRISKDTLKKLNLLKVETELKSVSKTVEFLIEFYNEQQKDK